jgi:hypothetical protein
LPGRETGIKVISLKYPEIDPESVAGVYMEAITLAKNEAYSHEVAFHTRKGCRANLQRRDSETRKTRAEAEMKLVLQERRAAALGYRSLRLEKGQDKRGRSNIKSVWVFDDNLIASRPVHEWVCP